MESPIAMGVDLSLRRTGVAFVGDPLDGGVETFSHGTEGKRDAPWEERLDRIESLAKWTVGLIHDHMEHPLIAVMESPPPGTAGGSTVDRNALWWFVYRGLRQLSVPVLPMNVAKVKVYATGKGNKHEKDEVMLAIVRRYPDAPIQNNDEADAVALAMMGARLLGRPYEKSLPKAHLRALEGVELPPGVRHL